MKDSNLTGHRRTSPCFLFVEPVSWTVPRRHGRPLRRRLLAPAGRRSTAGSYWNRERETSTSSRPAPRSQPRQCPGPGPSTAERCASPSASRPRRQPPTSTSTPTTATTAVNPRSSPPRHTGVVRCGGGSDKDFFVADLQPRDPGDGTGGEVAELFRYSSATKRWDLRRLDMPAGIGLPLCFETDAVFAFGGSMCWADYHRGILFCDVAADNPLLRFVRFPLAEFWEIFPDGRGGPEEYRTACVSGGRLWFVDVDDGQFRRARSSPNDGRLRLAPRSSDDGTVTTWSLRTPELEWTKEHTLRFSELWSDRKHRESPLPRSMPGFPMVDMRQAIVLHFVVAGRYESAEPHWTITVDMKNRSLTSYELYQNAIEVPEAERDLGNIFFEDPLICCELGD